MIIQNKPLEGEWGEATIVRETTDMLYRKLKWLDIKNVEKGRGNDDDDDDSDGMSWGFTQYISNVMQFSLMKS